MKNENSTQIDPADLVTTAEAATMLKMSANAFRIFVHRYGADLRRLRLGRRRTYFLRTDILQVLAKV